MGHLISAQSHTVPNWFMNCNAELQGVWITDNLEYFSEEEPFVKYIVEWQYGIGNQSLTGKLFGQDRNGRKTVFWEYRQYWDNETGEAVLLQFGTNNIIGEGSLHYKAEGKYESIQVFTLSDGRNWIEKHESSLSGDSMVTVSYEKSSEEDWKKKRTYLWLRQNSLELGLFSMSLSVEDLESSLDFYRLLDFTVVDGALEKNWLILKNGEIKLGLFHSMFPQNTITFNPGDARIIYRRLEKNDIPILFEQGVRNTQGPCSFSFLDPDGNPILIDQH